MRSFVEILGKAENYDITRYASVELDIEDRV